MAKLLLNDIFKVVPFLDAILLFLNAVTKPNADDVINES